RASSCENIDKHDNDDDHDNDNDDDDDDNDDDDDDDDDNDDDDDDNDYNNDDDDDDNNDNNAYNNNDDDDDDNDYDDDDDDNNDDDDNDDDNNDDDDDDDYNDYDDDNNDDDNNDDDDYNDYGDDNNDYNDYDDDNNDDDDDEYFCVEEPLCHELRPSAVLVRTMNYLLSEIATLGQDGMWAEWFDFLWDRTRGIRKDITQQMMCNTEAVSLLEKCARFHIFASERLCEEDISAFSPKINNENLTKCLQSLKYLYADLDRKAGLHLDTEAEFRSYMVLMNLNQGDILR
ncbi:LOW QUALITY PROTEIN: hypothetical protein Ahia01_001372500, partial [Argonauta hians]